MDFGLQLQSQGPSLRESLRAYRDALERLPSEFTTVWVNDHLQFGRQEQLEGWTLLTFLAGAHPRFRYGHLVLSQSFRNPGLLGKMAATLHELTEGKFILGLGAGWHEEEYRAYGYDYPRPGIRVDQLAEALSLIRVLWTESPATYQGTYYSIDRAYCEPRPETAIPILIGASGPKGLRLVARFADAWNWDGPFATAYEAPLEVLRAHCGEIGRPLADIALTAGLEVSMPDEADTFVPWFDSPAGDRIYRAGPTSADVISELRRLENAGVSHVQIVVDDLATLDRFVADVVPAFRTS